MRRVVITGMGIVSSLGTNQKEVTESLRDSRPGIGFSEEARDNGLRSHVCGQINLNLAELIDRKLFRFMCPASGYTYLATREAIEQAGLSEEQIKANTTGAIFGTGGASTVELLDAIDTHREKGIRRSVLIGFRAPWAALSTPRSLLPLASPALTTASLQLVPPVRTLSAMPQT